MLTEKYCLNQMMVELRGLAKDLSRIRGSVARIAVDTHKAEEPKVVEPGKWATRHPEAWAKLSFPAQKELTALEKTAEQRDHLLEQERRDHELVMERLKELEVWKIQIQNDPLVPEGYTVELWESLPSEVREQELKRLKMLRVQNRTVTVPLKLLQFLMNARLRDLPEVLKELTPYVTSVDEPSET